VTNDFKWSVKNGLRVAMASIARLASDLRRYPRGACPQEQLRDTSLVVVHHEDDSFRFRKLRPNLPITSMPLISDKDQSMIAMSSFDDLSDCVFPLVAFRPLAMRGGVPDCANA
jgi:hypothetical protein